MTTDARAAAWITAWDCLTEADRCRKTAIEARTDAVRDAYRTAMTDLQRQGELFAALVNASDHVGLTAGGELDRRLAEERERNDRNRDMFEEFKTTKTAAEETA